MSRCVTEGQRCHRNSWQQNELIVSSYMIQTAFHARTQEAVPVFVSTGRSVLGEMERSPPDPIHTSPTSFLGGHLTKQRL